MKDISSYAPEVQASAWMYIAITVGDQLDGYGLDFEMTCIEHVLRLMHDFKTPSVNHKRVVEYHEKLKARKTAMEQYIDKMMELITSIPESEFRTLDEAFAAQDKLDEMKNESLDAYEALLEMLGGEQDDEKVSDNEDVG